MARLHCAAAQVSCSAWWSSPAPSPATFTGFFGVRLLDVALLCYVLVVELVDVEGLLLLRFHRGHGRPHVGFFYV